LTARVPACHQDRHQEARISTAGTATEETTRDGCLHSSHLTITEGTIQMPVPALSYDRVGEGEPLLLLHGFGSTREDFAALTPDLAQDFSWNARTTAR
jgi:hypothetical protein